MKSKVKHVSIPIFIPHKGCPYDCIFCNQKLISGQIEEMTVPKMRGLVEEHLSTIDNNTEHVQIAFFGGSFTGIPAEEQEAFLSCANEYISSGRVGSIRISTRPDYINEEILNRLRKYNTRVIELGAQSMDDAVLKTSCRGHTKADVYKASALIKQFGYELGIQTMLGLPGDDEEKAVMTAKEVVEIGPSVVRIYPALVIKDTYMEKLYVSGAYKPFDLDRAVSICAGLMDIYEANGINVIRVGLQPTETINNDMDVIAGPFHPAFRQLVESRRMLTKMVKQLEQYGDIIGRDLVICTEQSNVSNVVGQKSCNFSYIRDKYGIRDIKVTSVNISKIKQNIYIFV